MSSLGQSSNAMGKKYYCQTFVKRKIYVLKIVDIDHVSTKDLLQESWAKELAPNMVKAFNNKDYHELTVSKLNQLIESWISKREGITTGFQSVFGKSENNCKQPILIH